MSHLADTTGTAVMPLDIDLATIGVPALPAPPPHVDFQREVHAVARELERQSEGNGPE